jgi:hypothetical protein
LAASAATGLVIANVAVEAVPSEYTRGPDAAGLVGRVTDESTE